MIKKSIFTILLLGVFIVFPLTSCTVEKNDDHYPFHVYHRMGPLEVGKFQGLPYWRIPGTEFVVQKTFDDKHIIIKDYMRWTDYWLERITGIPFLPEQSPGD